MLKTNKTGISLVALAVSISIILTLLSVATISIIGAYNNSKKIEFANDINMVQMAVDSYYAVNSEYPIGESAKISRSSIGQYVDQFVGEDYDDEGYILNIIDYKEAGLSGLKYGNKKNGSADVYVVSTKTGKVFYAAGVKMGGKYYYTLSDELNSILEYGLNDEDTQNGGGIVFSKNQNEVTIKIPREYTILDVKAENTELDLDSVDEYYNIYICTLEGTYTIFIDYIDDSGVTKTISRLIDKDSTTIQNAGNNKLQKLKQQYVQDKLIAWYDGILNTSKGHKNNATVWEDLTGNNNNGQLMNVNFNNTSGWTNKSLILDGIDDWVAMTKMHNSSEMTIEIVMRTFDYKDEKFQYYICDFESGGIGISKAGNASNIRCSAHVGGSYKTVNDSEQIREGEVYSISAGYKNGKLYCSRNGVIVSQSQTGTFADSNTIFALATNPNGVIEELGTSDARTNMEVYSVRIYYKCLSEEEILANYESDRARFREINVERKNLGYVADNLICLYDGHENTMAGHSNTTPHWVDLTLNNNNGTFYKGTNNTKTSGWTDNSLILDGIDDWLAMTKMYNSSEMTIEIVMKVFDYKDDKIQYFICNYESGGMGLKKEAGTRNFYNMTHIAGGYRNLIDTEPIREGQLYSISIGYKNGKLYYSKNGTIITSSQTGSIGNPNTIYALATNPKGVTEDLDRGAVRTNMEVYSVRMYSKCLSEEEVLANYRNDKERFEEIESARKNLGYVADGLICLYDGIENIVGGHSNTTMHWADLTLNNNDGILNNINYTSASGWNQKSLLLDGVDDWVKMTKMYNSSQMTVEIVAKVHSYVEAKEQYFIDNYESGGLGIGKDSNSKKINTAVRIGSSYSYLDDSQDIQIGKIYSLSAGFNGSKQYLCNNGTFNWLDKSGEIKNSNTIYVLGTNPNGENEKLLSAEQRFNIEIFSVRVYNRCLTQQEILQNYNNDKARFGVE